MIGLIRGTKTTAGLGVDAELDETNYSKAIKVSDREMNALRLQQRNLCPKLNYTISPRISGSS